MRLLPHAAALVLGAAGMVLPGRAVELTLFRRVWGDVIVNTEMTPAGRRVDPPTPQNPAYYVGRSLGAKLGSMAGEDLPGEKEMNAMVAKILAKQGFLGARPGVHEPTLFLVVQWGCVQPGPDLAWFLGYNADDDPAAPVNPVSLGPEVLRRNFRSYVTDVILDNADEPNFAIIVTAFDYATARTPHPVALWQTRIALPAIGKTMAEALPPMLFAAGGALGRDNKQPLLLDADAARRGTVELGELQIIDVLNDPSATPREEKKN